MKKCFLKVFCSLACASGMMVFSGCSGEEVEVYEVQREPVREAESAPAQNPPSMGSMPEMPGLAAQAQTAVPNWTVPASWTTLNPTSIRLGNFTAAEGTVSITVTSFPGTVGGLEQNITRWQGQIPAGGAIESSTESLSIDGESGTFVRLMQAGEAGQGVLGAILFRETKNRSWFIKMSGPASAVAAEETAFLSFADSIEFVD